ncbi:MAG: hypothetical protein JNJ57_14380 [Saprospiraceae bacterium]|nr:hypothetical protein [Saprospiraceae bacterium]
MATQKKSKDKSVVIANNDVVYLWWTFAKKIDNCLGFSIHRIIDGVEEKKGLPAYVGFDVEADPRKSPQTTDEWPIQSFNWKDLYAPHNKKLAYRIIPMMMENGNWKKLKPNLEASIVTDTISRTQDFGDIQIIFNRGLLSTQAFSKAKMPKADDIMSGTRGMITQVGNIWRKRLSGQMLFNINRFFKQKGKFHCALYELSDLELTGILLASKDAEIILSDSESNEESRPELHKAMEEGKLKVYDRNMKAGSIGHNKFVVYVDKKGNPKSVLTGSTNWTPTGLCGQTNNMVIINNEAVATQYLAYWNELKKDTSPEGKGLQDAVLRTWDRENGQTFKAKPTTDVKVWFSPNTKKISKPATDKLTEADIPVDMKEVFDLIAKAKKQLMYLVFNPGTPSIIDHIQAAAKTAKAKGAPIFVRGAVSDATIAKSVTTNVVSKDATLAPDTYKVTGVAAVPGSFGYWEKELLKLGFATIHDKVLVIDPFDAKNCVVITGSHNLGLKASYSNDENMVMIKGNPDIAQAYAAHVLDVVNHFKWRYKLQSKVAGKDGEAAKAALSSAWNDLAETDQWMDYYYHDNGDLEKEQLLFK